MVMSVATLCHLILTKCWLVPTPTSMILPMRRTPSWALERMMSSGMGWSTRLSLDVLLVSPSLSGLYLIDDEARWEMRADWKQLFMFFLIARIAL